MLHLEHPLPCTNCYYNTLYESHRHTSTLLYHERTRCFCAGGVMYGLYERFQMKIKIYAQRLSFFFSEPQPSLQYLCSFILVCMCVMYVLCRGTPNPGFHAKGWTRRRSFKRGLGGRPEASSTGDCFTTTLVLPNH